jgi:hypothetical protein
VPMGIVGVTGPLLEFHRSGKTRMLVVSVSIKHRYRPVNPLEMPATPHFAPI